MESDLTAVSNIQRVMCEKHLTSQVRADKVQRRGERWRTTCSISVLTDFSLLVKLIINVSKALSEQYTSVSLPSRITNQIVAIFDVTFGQSDWNSGGRWLVVSEEPREQDSHSLATVTSAQRWFFVLGNDRWSL